MLVRLLSIEIIVSTKPSKATTLKYANAIELSKLKFPNIPLSQILFLRMRANERVYELFRWVIHGSRP